MQEALQPTTRNLIKLAGLVVRVSTDRQARNEEGSLKTQLQRLRQHIEYKTTACGEVWVETAVYVLKGVSGKDSLRSRELAPLFDDIRAGRVNTVLCPALDRVSRSVKDFLEFVEFLNQQRAEFVCLKENFDTTTSFGRAIMTILVALAQLEREQTSERTRDAMKARSERGLWNGGRLLGYDPDPNKKSSVAPNPKEAPVVNYAFDKYLDCGSGAETVASLNASGCRTKSYTSRRGVFYPGKPFDLSTVLYMLRNPAYTGKKKITGPQGIRLVDAVWPSIVSGEKFEAVQKLLDENAKTNRNTAQRVQHAYVLSRGILRCGRCGSVMQGRSGTGSLKTKYFYYACPKCGVRVVADEIEDAILERVEVLATSESLLRDITQRTNTKLQRQKPALEQQRQGLLKALAETKSKADQLLENWSETQGQAGATFVTEKLNELAERRQSLETAIFDIDEKLKHVGSQLAKPEEVAAALARIGEVYAHLQPHERRDLVASILKQATVNEREIVLEIYAFDKAQAGRSGEGDKGEKVLQPPIWLPDSVNRQNRRHDFQSCFRLCLISWGGRDRFESPMVHLRYER